MNSKQAFIHPTAIIGQNVKIANGTTIGPYVIIDGNVEIGEQCNIHSHVVIGGNTKIGNKNQIFPFASIGLAPQDLKYNGEDSELIIGDNNTIREYVTMNPGTLSGGMVTKVGNNCLFMMSTHVAHDCQVGNNIIMANNATIAGHVTLGNFVVIGGLSAVHQFVKIGDHAMIGGMSAIESDVIPFGTAMGKRATLEGINIVGMKRRDFSREDINAVRAVYKTLFKDKDKNILLAEKIEILRNDFKDLPVVVKILDFIDADTSRSLCQPE